MSQFSPIRSWGKWTNDDLFDFYLSYPKGAAQWAYESHFDLTSQDYIRMDFQRFMCDELDYE